MASSFLRRKAEAQAKAIDQKYGAAASGGSASLSAPRTINGGGNGAPVTRASNFLTRKAQTQAASIDKQFGSDAYGGSAWTVFDKEAGFNSWLESVNRFSDRMSDDHSKRDGVYQSADSFGKYRDDAYTDIDVMQGRANIYRDYFANNRDLYGDEAVDGVLKALDEGGGYLESARSGLGREYDYWAQFKDETAYNDFRRISGYAELPKAEDFAEKSRYVSTYQPGTEKLNAWSGTYTNSGFGDIDYDYINRDETARNRQALADIQSNAALLGLDNSERGEMTDEEIAIFNYIYATQNPEAAYQYISDITSELNFRQRQSAEEDWAAYANEHPVGSSVFSVLESPLKGLSYLGQFADYTADGEIDQNEGYNKFSYINSAIRDEVNGIVEENWGGVGSFAYQTGMSMGDFLFNTAITGGNSALTLGIMGSGAAADTTIAAKDRGLSDDQAFALGTVAGAAEIITEKFSLDALLNTNWEQGAIKYILKNAFVEGSEEVGSDVINLVADVLISKDKSEWQLSIDAYKEAGYTDAEALGHAIGDQAMTMGLDFLGGMVSGGIMSGGSAGINAAGTYESGRQFNNMDLSAEDIQAFIDEGLASPPSTQAYKLATAAQQKLQGGGTLTNYELGALYQANARAIGAEEDGAALLEQAARDVAEGRRVSNRAASSILDNPSAVGTLTRDAGLSISDSMSKSQRREAVREAVKGLARPSAPSAAEQASSYTQETTAAQETAPGVGAQNVVRQAWSSKRLADAITSLGPQGQAQAQAFYNSQDQRADEYYGGFAAYYEAGVTGMDMGKVQSQYARTLNDAQKQAAYLAGQTDAATSLEAERGRVQYATVYGDEAGFIQDNHSAKLPRSTVIYYNNLARAAGVKIKMAAATGDGGANGWYSNGIINIAEDAEDPGVVVATHEITHRMQEMAPAEYRKYRDYAVKIRGARGEDLVEAYKARYARAGQNLSTEQAMDEIAADFTADLLRDVDGFRALANTERSVARKLLDAVRDFIRRVKAAFKGNKSAQNAQAEQFYGVDMAALEEAARLWGEALKATNQAVRAAKTGSAENGYSYSGDRFSMKAPVEETRDLLALHNLTEDKLLGDLRLGGLPMPSIAVVLAEAGHSKYGPISLVFSKDTISPTNRQNKLYGGDAWTPTFPAVEYEVNDTKLQNIKKYIRSWVDSKEMDSFGYLGLDTSNMEDGLNRNGGDPAAIYRYKTGMKYAYLMATGQGFELPMKEETLGRNSGHDNAVIRAVCDELGPDLVRELREEGYQRYKNDEAVVDRLLDIINDAYDKMMGEDTGRLFKDLSFSEYDRLVSDAARYADYGGGAKQEIDTATAKKRIDEAVDQRKYEDWLRELFDGVVKKSGIRNHKEAYTPSGNRRSFDALHYEITLENIVEVMRKDIEKGGGAFFGGGEIWGVATKDYGSVREMKDDAGRLGTLSDEEYDAIREEYTNRLAELAHSIEDPNERNRFIAADEAASAIIDALRKKKTAAAIDRELRSYRHLNIQEDTAKKALELFREIQNMPTGYFEAKPRRAVGFGEVLAAVIPSDTSAELRRELEKARVSMLEYKAEDEADRLAKVNSVEGARFSLKRTGDIQRDMRALEEENDLLRERMEYWRGQTRRTRRVTTDKKAVADAARQLIRDYGAALDVEDIAGDLQGLYDYIASGYDGKDELTYAEARRRADAISEMLVENAVAVDDDMYRQYSDLRNYLRTTKLNISEADSHDIADYGDFRRRNFGRLNLGKGDTNIDQVYLEMAELWPEFFDEQRESHPVDQLLRIVEVLDTIYDVEEYNPFSHDARQAAAGISNEIMERFFDLPQTKATFADRQARKLDDAKAKGRKRVDRLREEKNARIAELRAQNRERVQRAIQNERERAGQKITDLKERHAARDQAGRERRSARELRAKIIRHAKVLSQKLLRPSDKQHIPEELRGAVAAMLESINLESQYSIDPDTGKRAKNAGGDPTKRTEAFRALREQYEAISKGRTDFDGVVDPDLLDNLAEVISMKNVRLADMSVNQLATVWQTVRAIEQSISTANKLLGKSRFAGVLELADAIRQSSVARRTKGNWRGPAGWGDRLLNLDMMNPLTFLHQFGAGGDALYRELQTARDNRTSILAETVEQARRAIGKSDVEALRKRTHTFQVEGGELKLTTAQLMALYELNKRKQAQDHIYKGGIRATAQESGVSRSKGAKENLAAALGKLDAPSSGVKVTLEDMAAMLSALTEEEIRIADGLQAIMQGYLAQEGNRESMKVYGYQKFTEKDYFPISSDPHQVTDKIGDVLEGGGKRPRSIAEWGSAKGTVDKANNGLLLGDIFDVFAQHAVDMATYASHLGVMEDMNRVRNFTFRDGEGNRTGTMGDIIQRVTGQGGSAYLNKLLQDVSAGTAKDGVTGLARLTANYKAASVGLNLRVALQQPTSYLRAAAVMDPKYLADPRVMKRGGWEKALKNAPIARWKDWGNFEINQGRQIQDIMFNTDSKLDRARNAAMKLAGAMDSLTWGRIWNACELEVADKHPSLARGSAAFNEAVARRFTDVVDQTQVVDNVLGRSQIMRSGDGLAKMATSYMGEPTQSYNLVYRAFRDWTQEQDGTKRTAAKKALGRAVVALTASQFVNAIAQSLWDAVRDDDDRDEKYWERVLGHIMPNFASNANPVGMVPYLKDVVSVLQGYDVKRMDMAAITSFISACQNMGKAISGEGRYTLAGASANLIAEAARIFGLPAATVKRDLVAIARSVGVETGDWYFQYQLEKALNSVGYSGNRGEFYDIAFGALQDGELDVYQRIVQDLAAQGVKSGTIESAMRDRLKKALEEDPDFSLTQQARDLIAARDSYYVPEDEDDDGGFTAANLDPAAYQRYATQRAGSYREVADALEGFDTFRGLDNETKNKALDAAYNLAEEMALADNSGGRYEADTKWMLWATGGDAHGVDEAEAILFKVAYDMTSGDVDPDTGKTISGSKKENVLEAAAAMMPWLTAEELDYLKSNYWKE